MAEAHLEAATATTIISPRITTTIETWNVETMYETGKTAQLAIEMRNYNLNLWNKRIAMDWLRSEAADHRGIAAVFRAWTRCSSHPGYGSDGVQENLEGTYSMGGARIVDHHGNLPH